MLNEDEAEKGGKKQIKRLAHQAEGGSNIARSGNDIG